MASLEVDLSKVAMGQTITVKWRGKPVFIRRRSEEEIESARQVDVHSLRDPQTDEERVQNPEVRPVVVVLLSSSSLRAGTLCSWLFNLAARSASLLCVFSPGCLAA